MDDEPKGLKAIILNLPALAEKLGVPLESLEQLKADLDRIRAEWAEYDRLKGSAPHGDICPACKKAAKAIDLSQALAGSFARNEVGYRYLADLGDLRAKLADLERKPIALSILPEVLEEVGRKMAEIQRKADENFARMKRPSNPEPPPGYRQD